MNTSLNLYVLNKGTKALPYLSMRHCRPWRRRSVLQQPRLLKAVDTLPRPCARLVLVPKFDASSWHIPCLASQAFQPVFSLGQLDFIPPSSFFSPCLTPLCLRQVCAGSPFENATSGFSSLWMRLTWTDQPQFRAVLLCLEYRPAASEILEWMSLFRCGSSGRKYRLGDGLCSDKKKTGDHIADFRWKSDQVGSGICG
jgi:hypothetical protein